MGQVLKSLQSKLFSFGRSKKKSPPAIGFCGCELCVEAREQQKAARSSPCTRGPLPEKFYDLRSLPPEISMRILGFLDATDLCLAACVWELADDEHLWKHLCKNTWRYAAPYRLIELSPHNTRRALRPGSPVRELWTLPLQFSWRRLYLRLDEATLTFNADPFDGLVYLVRHGLVEDRAADIARFLHGARRIDRFQERRILEARADLLDELVQLYSFCGVFLPNALRLFLREVRVCATPAGAQAARERERDRVARGRFLERVVELFAARYVQCNPQLNLTAGTVYIVCFSLLLLSTDLSSPHVKNKMGKREFIKNTLHATGAGARLGLGTDLLGHMYDNVYLNPHLSPATTRY